MRDHFYAAARDVCSYAHAALASLIRMETSGAPVAVIKRSDTAIGFRKQFFLYCYMLPSLPALLQAVATCGRTKQETSLMNSDCGICKPGCYVVGVCKNAAALSATHSRGLLTCK